MSYYALLAVLCLCSFAGVIGDRLPEELAQSRFEQAMQRALFGDLDLAAEGFEEVIAVFPNHPESLHSLANIYLLQGRVEESIAHHNAAVHANPGLPPPLAMAKPCFAMCDLMWSSSFVKKRMAAAAAASPPTPAGDASSAYDAFDDHLSLALLLERTGFTDEARAHYERALLLRPRHLQAAASDALLLPAVYLSAEEPHEWLLRVQHKVGALTAAFEQQPPSDLEIATTPRLQVPGMFFVLYVGAGKSATRQLMQQVATMYAALQPSSLFIAPYLLEMQQQQQQQQQQLQQVQQQQQQQVVSRLRVGVVSNHFFSHSLCKVFCGVVRGLDRNRFEVFVFSDASAPSDSLTRLARARSRAFTLPQRPEEVVELLSAQRLHVLLLPDAHTDSLSYRLGLARVAPVQMALLAMPLTSGLPGVDYFVSSSLFHHPTAAAAAAAAAAEGGDDADHFCEQLLLFDSTTFFVLPPTPPSGVDRSFFGLQQQQHIYLIAQTAVKLHPQFDSVLSGVLSADPLAVIVIPGSDQYPIYTSRVGARLRTSLAAAAPDLPSRLLLLPSMAEDAFAALIRESDVILDPYPVGGGVSSLTALAHGAQLVTAPSLQTGVALTAGLLRLMRAQLEHMDRLEQQQEQQQQQQEQKRRETGGDQPTSGDADAAADAAAAAAAAAAGRARARASAHSRLVELEVGSEQEYVRLAVRLAQEAAALRQADADDDDGGTMEGSSSPAEERNNLTTAATAAPAAAASRARQAAMLWAAGALFEDSGAVREWERALVNTAATTGIRISSDSRHH